MIHRNLRIKIINEIMDKCNIIDREQKCSLIIQPSKGSSDIFVVGAKIGGEKYFLSDPIVCNNTTY
jgi:hypothetical protein